ncbi:MAG: translation initiation factor IF-1 [Candidatus Pacebacteria bacterium]|nr:translation initiation factor IF-1 [Candidatus Paceibacterota bacterium]
MINKEEQKQYITGTIIEALPNTLFRVELEKSDSKEKKDVILVYLSGKMRIHRIRVLVGDRVKIQQDSYGGRGRIVQRLK